MIVWIASYPRSGNTFLRVALHGIYGVPTYSVYDDDDPVAQRIGPALVGYRRKPADRSMMMESSELYLVKTHKRCKSDGSRAIYLVRDGRDAIVSNARLRASSYPDSEQSDALFNRLLREEIERPYVDGQPSSGTWGANVLSWTSEPKPPLALLRYEDLVVNPRETVQSAVSALNLGLIPLKDCRIPSFRELQSTDEKFFRRGVIGSHKDEMPDELHQLFWQQPENAAAMSFLGY